jgi:hypothetical protein
MVQAQQIVEQIPQPQAVPVQEEVVPVPPPTVPPIKFPRSGDVFVFRQLQGTGFVAFKYTSRESSGKQYDIIFFFVMMILLTIITYHGSKIFLTRRRIALLIFIACLIAIIAGVALDVTIPALTISILLFLSAKKKVQA